MGRQWLHAKRAIVNERKSKVSGKLTKEISVAAKLGGPDPAGWTALTAARYNRRFLAARTGPGAPVQRVARPGPRHEPAAGHRAIGGRLRGKRGQTHTSL
jgi:hypothetical protein